jgi:uncharacterized delta-60 repeat protein
MRTRRGGPDDHPDRTVCAFQPALRRSWKVLVRIGRGGSATGNASQRLLLAVAAGSLAITFGVGGAAAAAAGDLDTSFGSGGKVLTGSSRDDYEAFAVAIQRDGKIVAAGTTTDPRGGFALARYTKSGRLDASFGSGGRVLTGFKGSGSGAKAAAIQRDGKIVAAGEYIRPGKSVYVRGFAVVRYTKNGRLDSSFGSGGRVLTRFGLSRDPVSANAVAIQADGKIVAAGSSGGAFVLVRYTRKGRLDTSFGSGGKVRTFLGTGGGANAMAIQADGKLVVVGSTGDTAEGGPYFALLRYTKTGRLDTGFGSGGMAFPNSTIPNAADYGEANAVAIQPDGKIVAAGKNLFYNDFQLARFRENGSVDTSFGSGGNVFPGIGAGSSGANAVAIQRDGRIVAAGSIFSNHHYEFTLVRYTESGRPDTSFGSGGEVLTRVRSGSDDYANAIAIQPDGKIIVTGESVGVHAVLAVLRYVGD